MSSDLIAGDCREMLRQFPERHFRCCVTSPPYWGLRRYSNDPRESGSEQTLHEYVKGLVEVFREVRRVLADDGTLWLNLGDTRVKKGAYYWSGPGKTSSRNDHHGRTMGARPKPPPGLKSKDMIGIPWEMAFALRADGWYLRQEIIWERSNAPPESVRDRPTRSHEYLFLLSKSERYLYNSDWAREPAEWEQLPDGRKIRNELATRNWRSVWRIRATKSDHPAAFPLELPVRCIGAATNPGDVVVDPFCGSGTTLVAANDMRRKFVGIDLNPEYIEMARQRLGLASL